MTARIVLGVDPGTKKMGYGIVRTDGKRLTYVEAGTLTAPDDWPKAKRLRALTNDLVGVFGDADAAAGPPGIGGLCEVAAEDGVAKYASSALAVGEARGLVIGMAAAAGNREVSLYPPSTVKKAIAGHGHAGKRLVARAVKSILGMKKQPEADAADALAIAICHARSAA